MTHLMLQVSGFVSNVIRQGPAPTNLPVPPYEFLPDDKLLIG